jgi:hypothetical protein
MATRPERGRPAQEPWPYEHDYFNAAHKISRAHCFDLVVICGLLSPHLPRVILTFLFFFPRVILVGSLPPREVTHEGRRSRRAGVAKVAGVAGLVAGVEM